MDWKAHLFVAAFLSLAFFYYILHIANPAILLPLLAMSLISALVPDIDHQLSKGKWLADIAAIIFAAFFAWSTGSLLNFFAVLGAYFILYFIFKPGHRGITHSLVACALFTAGAFILSGYNLNLALAVFIGYFSHLAADLHFSIL
jgi:membrane-bound metal-dependent hydrolase YbcI (DUF457 family)